MDESTAKPKTWIELADKYGPWVLSILLSLALHYINGGGTPVVAPPIPTATTPK
jgi:hypothetical protein